MTRSRAAHFATRLTRWYGKNARPLPWRKTRDPYKIWISEVMLQQTTVATVIPYYKEWIRVFPDIKKLARAPLRRVLSFWQGLGYYQRARNIHKTARLICEKHGAAIPADPEILKGLPGFGPYTTGAVLSIAYGQRYPIIDANIRRVAMRLLALGGHADVKKDKAILDLLYQTLPHRGINIFNQALMELGALICRVLEPLCPVCPVKTFCLAYKKGYQDIIPAFRKKIIHKIEAAAAVITRNGQVFMQQRPPTGLLAGLWEFPGGKIEVGESQGRALARELKEELGVSLIAAKPLFTIRHAYTKFQVRLHVWRCRVKPVPATDKTHKWLRAGEFKKYPMPSATLKIAEKLNS